MVKKDKMLSVLLLKYLFLKNKLAINITMMCFVSIAAALSTNKYGDLSMFLNFIFLSIIVFTSILSMVNLYYYDGSIFQDIIGERGVTYKVVNATLIVNTFLIMVLTLPSIIVVYRTVTDNLLILFMTILVIFLYSMGFGMIAMITIFKMKNIPYQETICNISLIIYYFVSVVFYSIPIIFIGEIKIALFIDCCILVLKSFIVKKIYRNVLISVPRVSNLEGSVKYFSHY